MIHKSLRSYALCDWWALDETALTQLQRARRSLALVHELVEYQPHGTIPTVEVNQDDLAALLALVVENLEAVEEQAVGMHRYVAENAEAVRREVAA